jgi:hypothetical protein
MDKFLLIIKKYGVLKIVIRSQFKKNLPNKESVLGDNPGNDKNIWHITTVVIF